MTPLLWKKAEELKSLLMKVKEESKKFGLKVNILQTQEFPGSLVVKTSPSNTGGMGPIPGQGAKIPHASKNQTIKHKQYCNKFNKDKKKQKTKKQKKPSTFTKLRSWHLVLSLHGK